MHLMQKIIQAAQCNVQTIVLPEATDPRMLPAARRVSDQGIAQIVLLGDSAFIRAEARERDISLEGIDLVDHAEFPQFNEWSRRYAERRRHKGLTKAQAAECLGNPLYFGAMMVREGEADGMVAGAANTTADVLRAALQIIGPVPGLRTVSSCFLMLVPECPYGENGTLVYGDCGVVPDPSAEQLADIAIATAESMRHLVGAEPVVALLSFSTHGSSRHPLVEKAARAARLAKEKRPDLLIDGELQADAALVDTVGRSKAPGSPVAGQANTLIFPDLNSGNIAYKLTQRLAQAEAIGPLLQGLNAPVNDLSRGCSIDDIVNTIAVTALQAQQSKAGVSQGISNN